MKKKVRNGNLGITLIALVVTIIVLLILAAVSISTLTGDNSIIKKANQAKYASIADEIKEIVAFELYNITGDEDLEGKTYTINEKRQRVMKALSEAGFDEETAEKKKVVFNQDKTLAIIGNEYVVSLTTGNNAIEAEAGMWDWVDVDRINKKVGICGYNGTEDTIIIPEYVRYHNEIYTVTALKNCSNNHSAFGIASNPTETDHRFKENTVVKNITMLENITLIDGGEFNENSTIESVTMADSVTELGGTVFSSCGNLKKCRLSNSITVIPDFMFAYDHLLEEFNIPENTIEIKQYAFAEVRSVEELIIPKSVRIIGKKAFAGMGNEENAKLKVIIIEEGLEEVGEAAFANEESVEEDLYLPRTLIRDNIGKNAFASFGKNNNKKVYLFNGDEVSTSWEN